MMEIEMPPGHQSEQDINLIDILWRQDIDLGVGREVFDYSQRQKEYEIEKQKKLEKERQEQLLKEQEQALYSQLQLDEETGEFIPIQLAAPIETPVTQAPPSSLQHKADLREGAALSFDECMKILADTFQFVVDNETPTMAYQTMVPAPLIEPSQSFLPPEQIPESDLLQNTAVVVETINDIEETWEELLSIPELQCLGKELETMADVSMYPNPASISVTETADNYSYLNALSAIDKPVDNNGPVFSNDFESSFANSIPTETTNATFNVESFCDDIFTLIDPKVSNVVPLTDNSDQSLTELLHETVDLTDLSLCKAFNGNNSPEFTDSDSGISLNTSPCATSPHQSMGSSVYEDAQFGYSDSEVDDMDSTPSNVLPNPPVTHTAAFIDDAFFSLSPLIPHDYSFEVESLNSPAKELPVGPGHSKVPFAKDKGISRLEARFTRDEQRAKALKIPFSVDEIVNLPVDDFNELMSKHQFNEAQLALVRDIRRRGKNKVAAQNCRKRKMENIVELETDLDKLKYEKEKLLSEKGDYNNSLRLLKKQLGSLYMEVFSKLRDEDGKAYSPHEYSLQQTKDGNIFLVPKCKKLDIKKE
ncbi:nuclear factor erythroid 2-related factor 2 [Bombina bombina]|uniref:nuclear factor erythroid 2-related factor 2 n=1 Tax=Bombina bombina TaxID=8345 RepID=UPI00235AFAFD|nr:nuclear factor erythroid 2-related factor 2 [Bombina bombina]